MIRTRKQLLADFYLYLLSQPYEWQIKHWQLHDALVESLSIELETSSDVIIPLFKKMAREDE